MRSTLTLLLLPVLTLASRADAQSRAPLTAGDIIQFRNRSSSESPRGTLLRIENDTLFLRNDRGVARSYPTAGIHRLERAEGSRHQTAQGILGGGLLGAVLGAAVGLAAGQDCPPDAWLCFGRGATAAGGAMAGGVAGIVIGGAIGYATHTPRWASIELSDHRSARVAIEPHFAGGRFGLGIALHH